MKAISNKIPLLLLPLLLAACAHHTRSAPALTSPPPAPVADSSPATQKGFLTRTADATWDVVSAPVRLVTPQKKAAPEPPPTYQAPEAIIMTPAEEDAPVPTTQPR
jgi:hypothetical protein